MRKCKAFIYILVIGSFIFLGLSQMSKLNTTHKNLLLSYAMYQANINSHLTQVTLEPKRLGPAKGTLMHIIGLNYANFALLNSQALPIPKPIEDALITLYLSEGQILLNNALHEASQGEIGESTLQQLLQYKAKIDYLEQTLKTIDWPHVRTTTIRERFGNIDLTKLQ